LKLAPSLPIRSTIRNKSRVERASRSSLVTTSVSPFLQRIEHALHFGPLGGDA
jgi:hypothetical protein